MAFHIKVLSWLGMTKHLGRFCLSSARMGCIWHRVLRKEVHQPHSEFLQSSVVEAVQITRCQ